MKNSISKFQIPSNFQVSNSKSLSFGIWFLDFTSEGGF